VTPSLLFAPWWHCLADDATRPSAIPSFFLVFFSMA
jgi:hypothetical protein